MVVVDTSVIIDHLRQPVEKSALIKLIKEYPRQTLAISVVSIQELYEGKSTKYESKENALLSTLGLLEVLPYNTEVAKLAGRIARDLNGPIEFADAAIAATAISNGADLCTLNQKHFQKIPGVKVFEFFEQP